MKEATDKILASRERLSSSLPQVTEVTEFNTEHYVVTDKHYNSNGGSIPNIYSSNITNTTL